MQSTDNDTRAPGPGNLYRLNPRLVGTDQNVERAVPGNIQSSKVPVLLLLLLLLLTVAPLAAHSSLFPLCLFSFLECYKTDTVHYV